MKLKIQKKFFGVTLLELVFAMSIFAVSVVPIFANLTNNLKASKKSETWLQAENLSKSIMNVLLEKVRFKALLPGYYAKEEFTQPYNPENVDVYQPFLYSGGFGPITNTPLNNEIPTNLTLGNLNGGIEFIQLDVKNGANYFQLGDFIDFERSGSALVGNGRITKFNVFYEFLLQVIPQNTTFKYLRNKFDASIPDTLVDSATITVNNEIKVIVLHCYWLNDKQKNHYTLASIVTKDREDTDAIPGGI